MGIPIEIKVPDVARKTVDDIERRMKELDIERDKLSIERYDEKIIYDSCIFELSSIRHRILDHLGL